MASRCRATSAMPSTAKSHQDASFLPCRKTRQLPRSEAWHLPCRNTKRLPLPEERHPRCRETKQSPRPEAGHTPCRCVRQSSLAVGTASYPRCYCIALTMRLHISDFLKNRAWSSNRSPADPGAHIPGRRKAPPSNEGSGESGSERDAGGAEEDRTPDLLRARQALSRLSYGPFPWKRRAHPEQHHRPDPCVMRRTPAWTLATEAANWFDWWVWVDLNHRPHPYQGCALTC